MSRHIIRMFPVAMLAALASVAPLEVQAQQFSTNINTSAVARNEAQGARDWGYRVCIVADLTSRTAEVRYATRDNRTGFPTGDGAGNVIHTWTISQDTAGYPAKFFRGVNVEAGKDHIGNVYWKSADGQFKAMQPMGYGRNELWVEIDAPQIRANRYKSLVSGGIGTCGGEGRRS